MSSYKPAIRSFLKLILLVSLVVIFCFLVLSIPLQRQIGLTFRYDLVPLFIPLILLNYIVFRLPGKMGEWLAPLAVALTICLSVSGLWASGNSEQYILGGAIQMSDSGNYYLDALRFLEGGHFSSFSSDRPLMVSLFSGLLSLTSYNLRAAFILVLILPILSIYLAARELQRSHGTLAAALFISIIFMFYRRYTGMVMSETLGMSLGLLAFTLFWRYFENSRPVWLIGGLGMLALALIARLGAFFILPLLLIWIVWKYRKQGKTRWKTLTLAAIAAIAVAFAINQLVYSIVADTNIPASPQFTYHLYALVTGGQYWGNLLSEHPELKALTGNQYLWSALKIIWEHFSKYPFDLLIGIGKDLAAYFTDPIRGEFSYIDGSSDSTNFIFRSALALLAAAGVTSLFRQYKNIRSFLLVCITGLLMSTPFVPPTATFKLRLLASTIWLQALLPALGVAWLFNLLPMPQQLKTFYNRLAPAPRSQSIVPATLSLTIVSILIIIPIFIRSSARPTPLPASTCSANEESVFVRFEPGSHIMLVEDTDPRQGWLPYIRLGYFSVKVHNLPHSTIISFFEEKVKQPTLLINGLELKTSQPVTVLASPNQAPEKAGVIQACGHYQENPAAYTETFFFADRIQPLNIR